MVVKVHLYRSNFIFKTWLLGQQLQRYTLFGLNVEN